MKLLNLYLIVLLYGCGSDTLRTIHSRSLYEREDLQKKQLSQPIVQVYSDSSWLNNRSIQRVTVENIKMQRQGKEIRIPDKSFNIPKTKQGKIIRWADIDFYNPLWFTQGTALYTDPTTTRRYIVISWYGKDTRQSHGSRITLMDMETYEYTHILLVQAKESIQKSNELKQYTDYTTVNIHAGGIAVYKNKLYVASTGRGVRVFRFDRIFKTNSDHTRKKIGRKFDQYFALNYSYAIPQESSYYVREFHKPVSFLSLEYRDSDELYIWLGQHAKFRSMRPHMVAYKMNSNGQLLKKDEILYPKDKYDEFVYFAQGMVRIENTTWITRTRANEYKHSNARLIAYVDGDENGYRWRWPDLAEDLYYDSENNMLWSNNEGVGRRYIFSVKLDEYQKKLKD